MPSAATRGGFPVHNNLTVQRDAALWDRVGVDTHSECWEWGGRKNAGGYGIFTQGGKQIRAHRWVVESILGRKLERDELVLHSCDNPPCCNPHHLSVGTHEENMADMSAKGRATRHNALRETCKQGHPFQPDPWRPGRRMCMACRRDRAREYQRRKRLDTAIGGYT
jgi:hypothetical protein